MNLKRIADEPPSTRRGYHHGDLRRELLRVARDEIARNGAAHITLSSLAKLAMVSQAAPYRHFANMNDLLEALATEGFEEFCTAMNLGRVDGRPQDDLKAIALAYVNYASSHIELYRLMFASRLVPQAKPGSELASAADRAFEHLHRVVARAFPPEAVQDMAVLVWSQLHGLVMLKADGLVSSSLSQLVEKSLAALAAERRQS
jgi:AcrR family transcriptional regulator